MFYRTLIIMLFIINFSQASVNELKNLKTLQANFIQTIDSSNGTKIEYRGYLYIKNSGKILWSYKEPILKNVFVDGKMVIIDEPELEQAIYTNLENQVDILKLLNDAKHIKDNLYKTTIENIEYDIILNNKKIDKISYKDELENNIEIRLENTIYDEDINDNIFIFILPSNYDLIRK
ncbi:Outer-membrane lipoprotein carrier protein precursor [Aliarcobacter thereius]|uniref:Cell envelope biogenesis protein LolA n=1 Tax=Aliarcobacter thereius TaxID=544718 RepID=A0A5R9H3A6_9BACT|nr:LolA-like outer membrane lipoprotein chaperone [Aliarcobacter thereius]OCL87102.1 Outer-membrane lipoprotein carrier protein precursor [Aliarcobacter thereius]TLS71788.1 cell envelope biogenesis protein LolA [Aliarcobacter thereius]